MAADVHWTQVFVVVSHTGVAPLHEALDVHCTHRPSAWHAGRVVFFALHWASSVHAAQVLLVEKNLLVSLAAACIAVHGL